MAWRVGWRMASCALIGGALAAPYYGGYGYCGYGYYAPAYYAPYPAYYGGYWGGGGPCWWHRRPWRPWRHW
jgi:hypothetical protein